jgi:hypothetical protein
MVKGHCLGTIHHGNAPQNTWSPYAHLAHCFILLSLENYVLLCKSEKKLLFSYILPLGNAAPLMYINNWNCMQNNYLAIIPF